MEKAPFADLYGFVHPVHTATFIAGISGQTAPSGVAVYINTDGQLGMLTVQELKSIVAKQQATIAQQRKDFEANTAQQQKEIQAVTPSLNEQAAQLQKVSARIEVTKSAPRTVVNNR